VLCIREQTASAFWRNLLPVFYFTVIYIPQIFPSIPKVNRNLVARSIAVLLLSILFGYYLHYDERQTRQLGREHYLGQEAQKFDKLVSDPTPLLAMIIGGVLVLGFFVLVYEVVVFLISAVLKSKSIGDEKPGGNTSIPFS
jgi:hypothetical protein